MSGFPPADKTDFDNADANKIDTLDPCIICSKTNPEVEVWNNDSYNFINDDCPDTANPSLWRQSQLCSKQGLYKVVHGIYQVRGLDISNMTFVETPTTNGVVVIDPLTSIECAEQAIKLYQKNRPNKTIRAMIYTHCHADHFRGAGAVINAAGSKLNNIYTPDRYIEHTVSEYVYAGTAMGRRAVFTYGGPLEKSRTGQIGTGLGSKNPYSFVALSTGAISLIPPNKILKEPKANPIKFSDLEKITIDNDLEITFQITPGTEAPSEMNFYLPQYKALCMAENATHHLHNIVTLRGAVVRDARVWSRYLDDAITFFGKDSTVVFASHHWPTFGNKEFLAFLAGQRDLYAYLHNETVRQLNKGQTGLEIAEDFVPPESLNNMWHARGYYGSVSHNVKAIYTRYMGWFDATSQRYVEMMGGIENLIDSAVRFARKDPPDLRFAATLLSHAVFADQTNTRAKKELSSVFTKLGYGSENATWRNFYLTGAKELITGKTTGSSLAISASSLLALSIEQLMDIWALHVDGPEAGKATPFTIDTFITDKKYGWHLNLSNGALTGHYVDYVPPKTLPSPAATFTMWPTHLQLVGLFDGKGHPGHEFGFDTAGNGIAFNSLQSLLAPDVKDFAIVTPEKDGA